MAMGSTAKILVVDDHVDSVHVVARVLRMSGYVCKMATTFRAAVQAAITDRFDLVVCDIGLPDGNGCDLLRELQAVYKVPGIALTGHAMPHDLAAITSAGFVSHLLKPVEFEDLIAAVADALAKAA
jgi:CheY-like chemotaxis protein